MAKLDAVSSLEEESQLDVLQSQLDSLASAPLDDETVQALLRIFERFPDSDGYGLFWTILHLMEARGGYESRLVSSVEHTPTEFSLRMINRLLNGGVKHVDGKSLVSILRAAANNSRVSEGVRQQAASSLEFQARVSEGT